MELFGKWRAYNGFRVANQAKRVCINPETEHHGDATQRRYAYVESQPDGSFLAWYDVKVPGQIVDTVVGTFPSEREAMAAIREFQP